MRVRSCVCVCVCVCGVGSRISWVGSGRYVLVGGQDFLKAHAKQVLGVVEVMLNQSSMAAEQHILSCRIIDILLQLYPQDFAPLMENIFERLLFLSFAYPETELQQMDLVRTRTRTRTVMV